MILSLIYLLAYPLRLDRPDIVNVSDATLILKNIAGWEYPDCSLYKEMKQACIQNFTEYLYVFDQLDFLHTTYDKYIKLFYKANSENTIKDYIRNKTADFRDNQDYSFNTVTEFFNGNKLSVYYLYVTYGWTDEDLHNFLYDAYYGTTVS